MGLLWLWNKSNNNDHHHCHYYIYMHGSQDIVVTSFSWHKMTLHFALLCLQSSTFLLCTFLQLVILSCIIVLWLLLIGSIMSIA